MQTLSELVSKDQEIHAKLIVIAFRASYKNQELAENVLGIATQRCMKQSFESVNNLYGWFDKTCRNIVIDEWRKRKVRDGHFASHDETAPDSFSNEKEAEDDMRESDDYTEFGSTIQHLCDVSMSEEDEDNRCFFDSASDTYSLREYEAKRRQQDQAEWFKWALDLLLKKLQHEYKRFVKMYYATPMGKLVQKEIAEELKVNQSTVSRELKLLREEAIKIIKEEIQALSDDIPPCPLSLFRGLV